MRYLRVLIWRDGMGRCVCVECIHSPAPHAIAAKYLSIYYFAGTMRAVHSSRCRRLLEIGEIDLKHNERR